MTRLFTFWISHFSEKARFCLDFEGVPFQDIHLLPGPHALTLRKIAQHQHVPVLEHEGKVIQGSSAIVDAIPALFGRCRLQPWTHSARPSHQPSGQSEDRMAELEALKVECQALEAMADKAFGEGIQAFGYDVLLRDRKAMVQLWSYDGPWWAPLFYSLVFPLLAGVIRSKYCRNADHVRAARERFLEAMQETDSILLRQPYLLGDAPTRADVAVAALLSPLVRPAEHPMRRLAYPRELEDFIASLEGRPTWKLVEHMYREHRR